MQTVFVTAALPMMVRNLVKTGLLSDLAKHCEVVLLCPFAKNPAFLEEIESFPIRTEVLPCPSKPLMHFAGRVFRSASTARLAHVNAMDTYPYIRAWEREFPGRWMFSRLVQLLNVRRAMEYASWKLTGAIAGFNRECENILSRYNPAAVISSHPYLPMEWPILSAASRRGLNMMALIHSWDNPTSKGALPTQFKRVLVWSEVMRQELLACHSWLREEQIDIVGSPQHDLFREPSLIRPRAEFLSKIGLDPNRKLILLATTGAAAPNEKFAVKAVAEAIAQRRFQDAPQLWIRFYGDDSYKSIVPTIANLPGVHFEQASKEFWGAARTQSHWEIGSDFAHYLNLVKHSDVVVCGPSTVSIDAALLARPIVNMCYDGEPDVSHWRSVRRYFFNQNHYQRVVSSGAVRMSFDEQELFGHINDYLRDPTQEAGARQRLVSTICGAADGHARERIVSKIVEFVAGSK